MPNASFLLCGLLGVLLSLTAMAGLQPSYVDKQTPQTKEAAQAQQSDKSLDQGDEEEEEEPSEDWLLRHCIWMFPRILC
jgi:hypothetical protein